MINDYPNPWDFSNSDKNLISPNQNGKIVFAELCEIAMGAPISGQSFLVFDDTTIKLNDYTGGPVIWNEFGNKVALPIWTKNRKQKIAIVNINDLTITIFKKLFRVIHFKKFEDITLSGIDSPIYKTSSFDFDLNNENIESVKKLIDDDTVHSLK